MTRASAPINISTATEPVMDIDFTDSIALLAAADQRSAEANHPRDIWGDPLPLTTEARDA